MLADLVCTKSGSDNMFADLVQSSLITNVCLCDQTYAAWTGRFCFKFGHKRYRG